MLNTRHYRIRLADGSLNEMYQTVFESHAEAEHFLFIFDEIAGATIEECHDLDARLMPDTPVSPVMMTLKNNLSDEAFESVQAEVFANLMELDKYGTTVRLRFSGNGRESDTVEADELYDEMQVLSSEIEGRLVLEVGSVEAKPARESLAEWWEWVDAFLHLSPSPSRERS